MTSLSKHFMATDMSVTVYLSFRQVTLVFLGTGPMVVCLKHIGITDSARDRLKTSVKTLASWSVHLRSARPGNQSGPAAVWLYVCVCV
jgi:hypothetical protein